MGQSTRASPFQASCHSVLTTTCSSHWMLGPRLHGTESQLLAPRGPLEVGKGRACQGLIVREKQGQNVAQASAYTAQALGPVPLASRGLEHADSGRGRPVRAQCRTAQTCSVD